ncbi:thermosome subunit alpha [Methanoregula sp.]|uniref:thermosome subunit alpha n=1 Tax=Methanoregula sp. TaxID=2052170 RepID=UPI0023749C0C|nr:thermosome subunit alpha [Methanoregula sp.]MDD1686315.1 TCP-1/cpn60 chaperonin family protein [Methanoregula sp.]
MSQQLGGQQIIILREGTTRNRGQEAQNNNIAAALAVAAAVRSTLGPKGMDKMLIDGMGEIVITNDGATILQQMDIEHPAAKMMVEIAKTQDKEVGDGTTSAVILAAELLKNAENLLEQHLHPTVIAEGYQQAAVKSLEILSGIAVTVKPGDHAMLRKVAETAISGKGAEAYKDLLCDMVVKAITKVTDSDGTVDIGHVNVQKKVGGAIEDTQLIDGMVIDKERAHPGMPKEVKNAKILLLNAALEYKKTEVSAKINISMPGQVQEFLDEDEQMIHAMADKVIKTGATVVFCQKGIDDIAQHYLAKAGILAARRLKKSDMENIARATGATIVSTIDAITAADLGSAGLVEEKKLSESDMIYVSKCKNPKAVSLIIRGGSEHIIEDLERAIHDALMVVSVVVQDKKIVPGGGAPEIEVSLQLHRYASTVGGRIQLAIEAFAKALEIIPRTLADNAGLDPIDMLVAIRAAHETGNRTFGLDVYKGKPIDMLKAGVVEPLKVKTQAISSATEAAVMILRIDDVIASARSAGPAGGMPPGGMGGMPPGMG